MTRLSQAAATRKMSIMEGQAPVWDKGATDKEIGWYGGNIPVAGEGWSQGEHRGTDHGSTRTDLEHKIDGGQSLPYQIGAKVPTVQRCSWHSAAHNRRCKMQAGKAY